MSRLSFPTRKLKGSITRVTNRFKNANEAYLVYGVTNKEGLIITGKNVSSDLSNYLLISEKEFAYNPYRINVGSLGLSSKNFKGIVSPAYVVFKTKEDIIPEFLFRYLKSPLGINLIKWYGDHGGVRLSLRFKDLEQIDFPDLTKEQQLKFLQKSRKLNNKLSSFLERNEYQINLITKLKQSILQEAVQGKLVPQNPKDEPAYDLLKKIKKEKEKLIRSGKIKKGKELPEIEDDEIPYGLPKSWVWCRLGDAVKINPRNYLDNDLKVAFIPMALIKDDAQNKHSQEIREWGEIKSGFTHFAEEDVVFAKITPCFQNRKSAILKNLKNKYGAGTTELYVLRSYNKLVLPEFLFFLINTKKFIDDGVATYKGTAGQQRIKRDFIENYIIGLPSLPEQKRIVAKVDELMKSCDKLEDQIKGNKKSSELLMGTVLRESFEE